MAVEVKVKGPVNVASRTVYTKMATVPGIVYANQPSDAGDTLGTLFEIQVPTSGVLHGALLVDRADQGLRIDLALFRAPVTLSADDVAWALDDVGVRQLVGVLEFIGFVDHANCQTSELRGLSIPYVAPQGVLYAAAIARGATSVTLGNEPQFQLRILSDDPDWAA